MDKAARKRIGIHGGRMQGLGVREQRHGRQPWSHPGDILWVGDAKILCAHGGTRRCLQELTEVAHPLDPIRLFEQGELLRQAIFLYAADCSPFISSLLSTPLRIFSVERCTAGTFPVERSIPDPVAGLKILYREQERRKRVLGWRRAHKEPFEEEWEQIISWLVANPGLNSGDIFRELQRLSP